MSQMLLIGKNFDNEGFHLTVGRYLRPSRHRQPIQMHGLRHVHQGLSMRTCRKVCAFNAFLLLILWHISDLYYIGHCAQLADKIFKV